MVALRVQTVFPHAWSVSLLRRTLAPHCVLCVCARADLPARTPQRSEEHTSELQSQSNLVCRLLLEKKKNKLNCTDTYPFRTQEFYSFFLFRLVNSYGQTCLNSRHNERSGRHRCSTFLHLRPSLHDY